MKKNNLRAFVLLALILGSIFLWFSLRPIMPYFEASKAKDRLRNFSMALIEAVSNSGQAEGKVFIPDEYSIEVKKLLAIYPEIQYRSSDKSGRIFLNPNDGHIIVAWIILKDNRRVVLYNSMGIHVIDSNKFISEGGSDRSGLN